MNSRFHPVSSRGNNQISDPHPQKPAEKSRTGTITLALTLRRTSVLEAAERMHGIKPEVAQSCIAMLAAPGGLFLDVKSGYSEPQHLKWFASTLAGIGVNIKAVCSFVPAQIDFSALRDTQPVLRAAPPESRLMPDQGGTARDAADGHDGAAALPSAESHHHRAEGATRDAAVAAPLQQSSDATAAPAPPPRRLRFDSVRFFHGLNGLELACEGGNVRPGTCALFNGASLLLEDSADLLSADRLAFKFSDGAQRDDPAAATAVGDADTSRLPDLVDVHAWRRYCTLLHVFKLFGRLLNDKVVTCFTISFDRRHLRSRA